MTTNTKQPESAAQQVLPDNFEVTIKLPINAINVVLQTLDKNPLGVSVMQMSNLIAAVKNQADAQVKSELAKKPAAANDEAKAVNRAQRRAAARKG
jgi:hypothetical protein